MTESQETAAPFVDGEINGVKVLSLRKFEDERGWLAEIWRSDQDLCPQPAMSYLSMTRFAVQRGPHEHKYQTDIFVFGLDSAFIVYLWDARPDSPTEGVRQRLACIHGQPTVVIVPPGVVHAYKNEGNGNGLVLNLPTHLFKGKDRREPVDEIRHEEDEGTPYVLW